MPRRTAHRSIFPPCGWHKAPSIGPSPASPIEQVSQERLAQFVAVVIVIAIASLVASGIAATRSRLPCVALGALDELDKLAAIQPHTATLGAVVDLDALALGDRQDTSLHAKDFVVGLPRSCGGITT